MRGGARTRLPTRAGFDVLLGTVQLLQASSCTFCVVYLAVHQIFGFYNEFGTCEDTPSSFDI